MYPAKFDYFRANSAAEAVQLLADHQDARLLAGGHSLIPAMKLRLMQPTALIDIGRIAGLAGISRENGHVRIGALTTHRVVEHAAELPPALPEAAGWIGDPQVRNRGTVGGNVAHADPASDLPTVFTCLGATFHLQGRDGVRAVAATDFFTGLFETALTSQEILTAVTVPAAAAHTGSAYAKLFNPASRYAMVGAAVQVTLDGERCAAASVAVGGLTATATPCPAVAAALVGGPLDAASVTAAARAVQDDLKQEDIIGDVHASAAYRLAVAPSLLVRAMRQAARRAGSGA